MLLKTYLVTAVFILMCITSLGIYGFLVSAYQETAYELQNQESEIAVLQLKKERYQTLSNDIRTEKESLNTNITDLTSGLSNNVIQYTNAEGQVITTTSSATRKALQAELDRTISRRDILYRNEGNRVKWSAVSHYIARSKEVFVDFNPDFEFWAHTELLNRDDSERIIVTYKDNEMCPKNEVKYIESRKHLTEWYKVYGLGETGTYSERRIYTFEIVDEIPLRSLIDVVPHLSFNSEL